jgi:hypothetical protein
MVGPRPIGLFANGIEPGQDGRRQSLIRAVYSLHNEGDEEAHA